MVHLRRRIRRRRRRRMRFSLFVLLRQPTPPAATRCSSSPAPATGAPDPKLPKGAVERGDRFQLHPGEARPPGTAGAVVVPPQPTVHVVRDALVRVYDAAPGTNDASDMYVVDVEGVQILFRLVAADDDTDDPDETEPTVYVHLENTGRPKGTALVVDVNGNASDYRF